MTKDFIGNHGLVGSVEDVFTFAKPKASVEPPAKAAQVVTSTKIIARRPQVIALKRNDIPLQVLAESPTPPVLPRALPQVEKLPQVDESMTVTSPPALQEALPPDEGSKTVASPPALNRSLPQVKELKTAADLAAMIEHDLAQHPASPKQGLRVTVYGGTDWRAMLTILPAAGRVRNPQQLRDLTSEFAERLRARYDLAWD
jgi:hypothetical protein